MAVGLSQSHHHLSPEVRTLQPPAGKKKASTARVKLTTLGVLAVNHVNIWSWLTFPPKDLKRCAGFFPWIPCILSLSDGCHTHPAPCVSNPTDHWKTPEDSCCCCFVFIYAVSKYSDPTRSRTHNTLGGPAWTWMKIEAEGWFQNHFPTLYWDLPQTWLTQNT